MSSKQIVVSSRNKNGNGNAKTVRRRRARQRAAQRKRSAGGTKTQPSRPVVRLSPCVKAYSMALLDPFGSRSRNLESPCIPDDKDVPSYKFSVLSRGSLTLGTAGFGFILAAPMSNGNDAEYLATTVAAYAGNTVTGTVGTAGVLNPTYTNFPWAQGSVPVRLVANGLRIRYTGTELNRGGSVVVASAATWTDNFQGNTFSQIANRSNATMYPVNRQWIQGSYRAVMADLANTNTGNTGEYVTTNYDLTAANTNGKLVMAITGEAGNTFEYEWVAYYEAIPYQNFSLPMVTASHSDLPGFSWVRDYANRLAATEIGSAALNGFQQFLVKSVAATASTILPSLTWARARGPIIEEM